MTINEESTSNVDNSSAENLQEQISSILDESIEPTKDEADVTEKADEKDDNSSSNEKSSTDNTSDEVPVKFKNEDGTVSWDKVLKSYKELEPLVNQKSQWEKDRADLQAYRDKEKKQQEEQENYAKQHGFDSVLDMQQTQELVELEANEYAKYLQYTEDPEATRKLLLDYIKNPSPQLLDDIELEFPASVIKRVTVLKERQEQLYKQQASQFAETTKMSNIESIIGNAVQKNSEIFDYEPFKQLFLNALHKFGDKFTVEDSDALINTMMEMKKLFMNEFSNKSQEKIQNDKATDKLSAISTNNSAPTVNAPDISKMTQKQLTNYLKDFV